MKPKRKSKLGLCLGAMALVVVPLRVRGQMLTYLRGEIATPDLHETSPAYELEYRQALFQQFSGSFDYINEGHFTGHHRDGYGIEAWYKILGLSAHRLSVTIGAGPYYFFDTVTAPGGASADIHGVAPVASVSARGTLGRQFYWMVAANRINPTTDFKTNMVAIGGGYWLGKDVDDQGDEPGGIFERESQPGPAPPDEISVYGVLSVINISSNPKSFGGSLEYRHRFNRNIGGTLTYIYEGDPRVARRSGFAAQVWPLRSAVIKEIEIGIGFGGYVFIDRRRQPLPGQKTSAAAAGLISLMASYDVTEDWFVRLIWDRVVSDYNRDADIWRIGFGRKL